MNLPPRTHAHIYLFASQAAAAAAQIKADADAAAANGLKGKEDADALLRQSLKKYEVTTYTSNIKYVSVPVH
jgi:hypothetical protein